MSDHYHEVVARLQARVEKQRLARAYDSAVLTCRFESADAHETRQVLSPSLRGIRLRHELGFSSKPVVGSVITGIKRIVGRLIHNVVQDGFDQASLGLEHLDQGLADVRFQLQRETEQRAKLEAKVAELTTRLDRAGARGVPRAPP